MSNDKTEFSEYKIPIGTVILKGTLIKIEGITDDSV
jgi:hypothetical protein